MTLTTTTTGCGVSPGLACAPLMRMTLPVTTDPHQLPGIDHDHEVQRVRQAMAEVADQLTRAGTSGTAGTIMEAGATPSSSPANGDPASPATGTPSSSTPGLSSPRHAQTDHSRTRKPSSASVIVPPTSSPRTQRPGWPYLAAAGSCEHPYPKHNQRGVRSWHGTPGTARHTYRCSATALLRSADRTSSPSSSSTPS
jgi:hypothetical protein